MRVFRYQLDIVDRQTLRLPMTSVVMSVAPSRDYPNSMIDMWCRVPELAPDVPYTFLIYGTGHQMESEDWSNNRPPTFVGTCVLPNDLVFHVFYMVDR